MKTFAIAAAFCLIAGSAFAQGAACSNKGSDGKMLAGAALSSRAKSCCAKQATDRKLAGAAKTSFTTKCEKDVMGG